MGFDLVAIGAIISLVLLSYMTGRSLETGLYYNGDGVQCSSDDRANFMEIIDVKEVSSLTK